MVLFHELFFQTRYPSGWLILPFIAYAPLGLAIAIFRFFMGLHVLVVASLMCKMSPLRAIVLRMMCVLLGVYIIEENEEIRDDSARVIVTNNVSILDHIVIHLLTGSYSPGVWTVPSLLHFAFNYKNLGSLNKKRVLIRNVKCCIDDGDVIDVQPENEITSGRKGLLRFSTWPCELSQPIQPATIRIERLALFDVKPSVISATWLTDLFWFLFVPTTMFTVKYLPVILQEDDETPEEMSKRVEHSIATDLDICQTNYKASDKAEYMRRLATGKPKPNPAYMKPDPKLMDMAWKVKEVLPDVPVNTICAELMRSKSIDVTIANFVEGLVQYVPEEPMSPKDIRAKKKSLLEASGPSSSSLNTFPKSSHERMISFQERKRRLIENARQSYTQEESSCQKEIQPTYLSHKAHENQKRSF